MGVPRETGRMELIEQLAVIVVVLVTALVFAAMAWANQHQS